MPCRMGELRQKEVINVRDGGRLGFVCDVEIDTHTAQVTALVVYGRSRLFGLLGREPDTVIPWRDIEMIGGDIVLVKCDAPPQSESLFMKLWKKLTG
ncbi:YlmC/YmxH family sporulation protein [Acutalibacter muris]|uniref:YlmC/YmxH family sporulation protein n=1 Tax=Acutalibacter muris TaxID=1796620 RepID=A0A1Z2XV94_9FIRM|nr:YlmC/YmxH family sporulation protein [Acutalibacter muris]ANU54414.1 YlmC/YmxH family sporulation protein [Hungateiclostridiaceae bacterium KB18]ASB42365.1 YlmC/YmxH family sporulation protein [Acutalibacter muris]QQR31648.1 YlmC/YmxH family sporulation protein [Acutalibacter muris]